MADCTVRGVTEVGFVEACLFDVPIPALFLCGLLLLGLLFVAYNLVRIWWG